MLSNFPASNLDRESSGRASNSVNCLSESRFERCLRYKGYVAVKASSRRPIMFYTGLFLSSLYLIVGTMPYLLDTTQSATSFDDPGFSDKADSLIRVYYDPITKSWNRETSPNTRNVSVLLPKSTI